MMLYPGSLDDYERSVDLFSRERTHANVVSVNHLAVRSFGHLLAIADGKVPEIWKYDKDTPDRYADACERGLRLLRIYNGTRECGDIRPFIENVQDRWELGVILRDSGIDAVMDEMDARIVAGFDQNS